MFKRMFHDLGIDKHCKRKRVRLYLTKTMRESVDRERKLILYKLRLLTIVL